METAVVHQFLDFFQDFLKLCQLENWPNNETSESEIKNAFIASQHVAKCLDKLQKKELLNEFISTLDTNVNVTNNSLKFCLNDPSKYVLKKIINSYCAITKIDLAFKIFLEYFPEDQLEDYLTEFMIDTASKETLVMNLTNIPRHKVLLFKSQFLLLEIGKSENKNNIVELLKDCDENVFEILVVCLLNKNFNYQTPVHIVADAFIDVMILRNMSCKKFWTMFFGIDDVHLQNIFLNHENIFKAVISTIVDCGRLLKEHMSTKYFYIDLSYSKLVLIVQNICQNQNLKLELFDTLKENDSEITFWENMI